MAADTAVQQSAVLGCKPEDLPVHSVRLKGLYSIQALLFGGPGGVLRITHEVFANDAFGPGILAGLRHVASAPLGMLRGVGHAFRAASM
jgi:4-hydroxy-tetrahydrodipicolinate reductase